MKQKEWLIIGAVALFSAIFSIVLSGLLFGSPKKNPIKVPVVTKISSSFPDLKNDSQYSPIFNQNALDPTQPIQIGGGSNTKPFNGSASQ